MRIVQMVLGEFLCEDPANIVSVASQVISRLRTILTMCAKAMDMLLNGFPHIPLGGLDGLTVAEAAGNRRTICEVPFVLRFLFDDNLK